MRVLFRSRLRTWPRRSTSLTRVSETGYELVPLLANHALPEWPVHLLYPQSRFRSNLVRTYLEYCERHIEEVERACRVSATGSTVQSAAQVLKCSKTNRWTRESVGPSTPTVRSEESSVGKAWVITCKSRWSL